MADPSEKMEIITVVDTTHSPRKKGMSFDTLKQHKAFF